MHTYVSTIYCCTFIFIFPLSENSAAAVCAPYQTAARRAASSSLPWSSSATSVAWHLLGRRRPFSRSRFARLLACLRGAAGCGVCGERPHARRTAVVQNIFETTTRMYNMHPGMTSSLGRLHGDVFFFFLLWYLDMADGTNPTVVQSVRMQQYGKALRTPWLVGSSLQV